MKNTIGAGIYNKLREVKEILKSDTAKVVLISGIIGAVGGAVKHTLEDKIPQKSEKVILQEKAYEQVIDMYKEKYRKVLHIQKEDVHLTPWQLWDVVHGTRGWEDYINKRIDIVNQGKKINLYNLDVSKTNELLAKYNKTLRVDNIASYAKASRDPRINENDKKLFYAEKGPMPSDTPMFIVTHWTDNKGTEKFTDQLLLGNIRSFGQGRESVHFVIGKSGRVVQMAPIHRSAAAAPLSIRDSKGRQTGRIDPFLNAFGIHIELVGAGGVDGKDPKKFLNSKQLESLYDLYEIFQKEAGFPTTNIIGHLEGNNIEINRVQFERKIQSEGKGKRKLTKECHAKLVHSDGIRRNLTTNYPDVPKTLAAFGLNDCTNILGNNYTDTEPYHYDFSHAQMNKIRADYKTRRHITN